MTIDPRIRQVRQFAARNHGLAEQVAALTVERDGLLAQLGQAREDVADARRSQSYAEDLALAAGDRATALAAERDALRAELSTGRRVQKGK